MSAPATPWMRRLPRRPDDVPKDGSHLDLVHPPRTHPGAAPAAPAAPPPVTLTVLASPAPPAAVTPPPTRGAALMLVPPRGVTGVVTLDPDDPVARMDALQSGIGALVVRGAERVAWEDVEERTGVIGPGDSSTGDDMPLHGNRSLVRPLDGDVVVTLRHVRRLRRLLIDVPANTATMLLPYRSGSIRAADASTRLRLSVVVVDGRLEARAEYGLPDQWGAALQAMGWSPLASIPRATPDAWQ